MLYNSYSSKRPHALNTMKADLRMVSIFYANFLCYQNISLTSSFLPQYLVKEFNIESSLIGFIFSLNAIGVFISAILLGAIMKRGTISKKSLIITGAILQMISMCFYLILQVITNKSVAIFFCFIARANLGVVIIHTFYIYNLNEKLNIKSCL